MLCRYVRASPVLFSLFTSLTLLAACNQSDPSNPPGLGEPPPGLGETSPVIYVNVEATGSGNGSSWANAYTDLETAVENTSEGQLWVAKGSYDLSDSLGLKSGVAIYGGFAGTETNLSGRSSDGNLTIIDGSNASGPVVSSGNVDETAVLDGFTIQNGAGGLSNSGGSPRLGNLTFSNNEATSGGGMYNKGGSPELTKVTFTINDADNGGGFYTDGGSPTLNDVSFGSNALDQDGNKAKINGGGMYIASGNPSLTRVTFYNNSAGSFGGGLYIKAGSPTLDSVNFFTNTGLKGGGGLYNSTGSLTMTSGTFSNNTVDTGSSGGGVYNDSGSVSLQGTSLTSNKAQLNGGGLYNQSGSVNLSDSFMFQGNTAAQGGGGLYSAGGGLTLDKGGFSTNKATGQGGGLYTTGSEAVKITNVTFSKNEASTDSGGGVYITGGGALTLNAGTVAGNTAGLSGGGLYASGDGMITLAGVGFTNNTATNGGGGGMYNSGNTLTFEGDASKFNTNTALGSTSSNGGDGGGLYHEGADAELVNVSFGANKAYEGGGGMYASGDAVVTLEGVTFSNNGAVKGGGLYNSGNTLVVQDANQSKFTSNTVITGPNDRFSLGGGLYHENADASLKNIVFSSNNATTGFGGGAYVTGTGKLTMENVDFMKNTATVDGGGLGVSNKSVSFDHGSFTGNQAGEGGGMVLDCVNVRNETTATLSNLVFSANTAIDGGGLFSSCELILANVTMSGNQASALGGGLFLLPPFNVSYTVQNSVLWGNQDSTSSLQNGQVTLNGRVSAATLILKNNLIQGGFDPNSYAGHSDVENTLTADPLFVCAPGGSCSTANLQLQSSSAAINNGNNSFVPNGVTTDLAGKPRIFDNIVDLGAYEFQGAPTLAPPTTSPTIDSGRYAQCAGDTGKWASGYKVRYAASFVGADGRETDKGPWTSWTNGSPYMLPNLQDVPIDPSGRAAARRVYRQFQADYVASNPSAGVTLTGTLNDNTTTELQDEDAAGTPGAPCPN